MLCFTNMASISQGLVLTTAMVLSSTVLYLAFSKQKNFPLSLLSGNSNSHDSHKQILRSCVCSGENRKNKNKKKKKKVQFAENVKEVSEEKRKENRVSSSCSNEIHEFREMPANRIALYKGILRDRVQRIEFSC